MLEYSFISMYGDIDVKNVCNSNTYIVNHSSKFIIQPQFDENNVHDQTRVMNYDKLVQRGIYTI